MSFSSWTDFQKFISDVKSSMRFIHSDETNIFIENLSKCLPDRVQLLPQNSILFRAQIGFDQHESEEGELIPLGLSSERMKPIPHKAIEGRANPKGIAYLYLSNDENTALSELRPHLGQWISSAQFKTQRDLKLINCYSINNHYTYIRCIFEKPKTSDEIQDAIWSLLNDYFTKPVTNDDESTDYVPTQILAELFKSLGYDGICYKSAMGKGLNYILFNLDDAELINCTIMETTSIGYEFNECATSYFIRE